MAYSFRLNRLTNNGESGQGVREQDLDLLRARDSCSDIVRLEVLAIFVCQYRMLLGFDAIGHNRRGEPDAETVVGQGKSELTTLLKILVAHSGCKRRE